MEKQEIIRGIPLIDFKNKNNNNITTTLSESQIKILEIIYEITKNITFDLDMILSATNYTIHPNTVRSALKRFLFMGLIEKTKKIGGETHRKIIYDMTLKGAKFFEEYK